MADTPLYLQSHFREQVQDTFREGIQQKQAKFRGAGIIDPDWTADQRVIRNRNTLSFVETTGQRGGKTQQGEFQAGFRSGFRRYFEAGIQFDRNDARKLGSANLPTSEVQQDMVSAWNRQIDSCFIDAAHANALGGERPYTTPQALPADMSIAVTWDKISNGATNTNLTYWKINEGIARMEVNDLDVEQEMLCLAISPRMKQAWMAYAAGANTDTFAKLISAWLQKPSEGLLGCKVIVSNRLKSVAGNVGAVLFTQRAFIMSDESYEVKIDELATDRHSIQIAPYANLGVMRAYDERVKLIWCDPTKPIVP